MINGIIESVSLSMNRKIENSEEKFIKQQKKELEEEIKEKTKKLQESEETYRLITENVNDVISVFDKNLNLIYINEAQQKISGFSREEVMGKKPMEFMHPDDIRRCVKLFQEALKTGNGFGEFRLRRKDGTYIWLEINAKIIVDKNGETKAVLVSRDIHERKLMEEKLKKSEEKYRLITENAYDIILVINQKLECEYINEQVSMKLWGYNKNDLIGKSLLNLIHHKDLKTVANLLKNSFKMGEDEARLRVKKKNGNYAWFEIRCKSFINGEGIRKGLFFAIDITEQKQAEEKYRHLFEHSPFSITLIDLQGNIIDCNPAVERLIKYKKEELIHRNFKNLSIIHPRDLPILLKRFKKSMNGEILPSIDVQLYKKDGSLIWINYTTSLVNIGNKKLMQIIFYDITERRKAAKILLKEMKKLKELDQIRNDLITRVSHELKTPLISVCGAIELLLNIYSDKFGKEELELLEMVERGGKKLRYLINTLIDISRLKHKELKLKKQPYDLSVIIKDSLKEFNLLIKKRKIHVNLNLPKILYANIDRIRVEQVIANLLSNAIKNTPPNGRIQVNLQEIEDWAKISIHDTGIGLTKDEMEKIFTQFGKIERSGQGYEYLDIEGAGLGLYISKEIVNLHGGQIWAESSGRHNGSTFVVKLPIK